jgi:glycosyltransferase involved in cell wall biosynthesis
LDTRRKIGIVYNYNDKWIGGTYYINSIIAVLKEKRDLFELFIITNNKKNKINDLPFVYFKYSLFDRIINLIRRIYPKIVDIYLSTLGKRNIKKLMFFDFIFPVVQVNFYFEKLPDEKKIYWIADLQENYFPAFFQKQDIFNRIVLQIEAAYSRGKLVLSSQSANNDFLRLYPKKYCVINIISFISSLYFENNNLISYKEIEKKYNLKEKYFICSNQFWRHKNHSIIVDAVSILKKQKININVYFTGKEYDYRDSEYTLNLKTRVQELSLIDNIHFLGFIPRKEQITLMKYAHAIIQPSFFEGWNTTIEDAKYLEKEIIASNISVHIEQLKDKNCLFDPLDADDLAFKIKEIYSREAKIIDYSYKEEYLKYQKEIFNLFSNNKCLDNK